MGSKSFRREVRNAEGIVRDLRDLVYELRGIQVDRYDQRRDKLRSQIGGDYIAIERGGLFDAINQGLLPGLFERRLPSHAGGVSRFQSEEAAVGELPRSAQRQEHYVQGSQEAGVAVLTQRQQSGRAPRSATFVTNNTVDLSADDWKKLQQALNEKGFDAGPNDGIHGPLTQAGLEQFRRDAAVGLSGLAGSAITTQDIAAISQHLGVELSSAQAKGRAAAGTDAFAGRPALRIEGSEVVTVVERKGLFGNKRASVEMGAGERAWTEEFLRRSGYDVGKVDGNYDQQFYNALDQFRSNTRGLRDEIGQGIGVDDIKAMQKTLKRAGVSLTDGGNGPIEQAAPSRTPTALSRLEERNRRSDER